MNKAWIVVLLAALGLSGLLLIKFAGLKPTEAVLDTGFVFPDAKPLSPFTLTDQDGKLFDNSRLKGKWSLIFLGYTFCPDICPTTMAKLAAAYPALNEAGDVQVIFVSVDPGRDSAERLKQYAAFYHPDFIAVSGEHKALLPFTRELGMVYAMVGEGDNYQVDHSASIVVISPSGEKYAVFKPKSDGKSVPQILNQALIADMRAIRRQF
ncbi:SCO family protein [Shewanella sp. JM162201]|uniref:SCO family protein n=1 Tax=Shewanella jiangmenensis TaxID=2837387 RepID=A0ABS5V5F5_9GAMM|nr:SCO family protein [Shewanella jiangmenensis]MBT1445193.1 SCO family protein [Shewanella jiangmenensis]